MSRADEGMGFLLKYENVAWYENGCVKILDRRIYPMDVKYVECYRYEDVAQAITDMVTQSAGPYTAAAMGMALAAYEAKDMNEKEIKNFMKKAAYTLSHARPTTAAKMMEITDKSYEIVENCLKEGIIGLELVEKLRKYAFDRIDNNYRKYESVGKNLASLIPDNGIILTQCFGETIIGTLFNELKKTNKNVKVYCAETRPYFQGARLTASVIYDMGFDVTVISDNMIGYTMRNKGINVFTSAADVITMNGCVINKVGTFQMALMANYFGIPYYVTGSPDKNHPDTSSVKIEERDGESVLKYLNIKIVKEGVKGYYPAFDITPSNLVTGIVTSKGIYKPEELYKFNG